MLAGRGFNKDIEETYAGEHPELNFTLVNSMESNWKVSSDQLYQFLVDGNLIEDAGTTQPVPSTGSRGS